MLRSYLLVIALFLQCSQLCAQFQPHVDYASGPSPYGAAVGDFNGDNKPDLVVTNNAASSNTLGILLGNGDGTFQAHTDIAGGGRPLQVIVADFNNDGGLDLAVANSIYSTITVLLGKGDGTFQPPVAYATGQTSQWLVAADFNGDGRLDIATANYGADYWSGSVSILLGSGDGTFQSQIEYPVGVNPFGIMAADFNHDGKRDLAVVCNNGSYGVWILLGNGDGSFQSAVYNPSGYNPRVGHVADLNGDGNLDIAIANCISNNISILMGDGGGSFAPQVNYGAGSCPQTLAGGDFNGDEKLDLVTSNSQNNNVTLLKGNGDGTFQSAVGFSVGASPMWVAVADFNGDTAPDLVVTNVSDNTVSVLLNQGTDFSFAVSASSPATIKRGQSSLATISMALLSSYGTPSVNLTCSVEPAESAPTCSFNPNPATFTNGLATSALTLDTKTTVAARGSLPRFLWLPVAGFALIGLGFRSPRRKPLASVLGVLLLGGLIFQGACGEGGTVQQPPPTQPQTYTITVTGTSGATHSATTTLTVN